MLSRLADNLKQVNSDLEAACERSGRAVNEVSLVAVTKYAKWEWVEGLWELGQRSFGESRPQQLTERVEQLSADWHLIGHLQRNKVRPVLQTGCLIHSVDSWKLLERIENIAQELKVAPRILLEVNISAEAEKDGFRQEELLENFSKLLEPQSVQICGLMGMAAHVEEPEATRPSFRKLRELRNELVDRTAGRVPLLELSMGMSNDFQIAIEEGATMVRIGSRLYQGLAEG